MAEPVPTAVAPSTAADPVPLLADKILVSRGDLFGLLEEAKGRRNGMRPSLLRRIAALLESAPSSASAASASVPSAVWGSAASTVASLFAAHDAGWLVGEE